MTDPTAQSWNARIQDELTRVIDDGRWRSPREFDALGPAGFLDGKSVVSFASNDYLGLSAHPADIEGARAALERWGTGSGASRLVTGSRPIHAELEHELAAWKGTEAAVCFPTGFAANLGVLCTLGGSGVRVLSDQLNHASIIDGCRLSRSPLGVYRHGDMAHLEELLSAGTGTGDGDEIHVRPTPTIVVTDTVFSMDGDAAPLDDLLALCARHGALLVLDEAHAVLGPTPNPCTESRADESPPVIRVGTLSKTLGSLGGFVAASRDVVDLLVNKARPYIFSTALTPADAAAALAALKVLRSGEGAALVAQLRAHLQRLIDAGLAPPGHPSPIVPVIIGSERAALDASAALLAQGLWVPAIRPPTVAPGTSRLRVTLSAAHRDEDVVRLVEALCPLREAGQQGHQAAHSTSASLA